ncbi:MAG: (4Fe-4S)-binding protein [Chloroflexota bacterium]
MSDDTPARQPTIKPLENGPLMVRDVGSLTNSRGETLESKSRLFLCRCGGSAKKPFCDNSHAGNGFSSANERDASADVREGYTAADLAIHDDRTVCAHIGFCSDGLPSVFKLRTEPWIDPAGADAEAVAEVVQLCPSGALSYSIAGEEHGDVDRAPAVVVSRDGPYFVVGGVELETEGWGEGASREHYALVPLRQVA